MKLRTSNMKFSVGLFFLAAFALGQAQTVDSSPEVKKEILTKLTQRIESFAFVPGVKFDTWGSFLEAQKAKIDEAKDDTEFKSAVNEALRKFGFSHIVLATPKDMKTRSTGQTVGIGISSQEAEDKSGRIIIRVVDKSPAKEAGLEPGDKITAVDDKPFTATTILSGDEGTKVKLKVVKPDGKAFEYTITRRPFSTVVKDDFRLLNPTTGLLKVNTFDRAYSPAVIDELMLDAVKVKNLIVDLRFNGGGAVINLLHFAGYFVDPQLKLGFMLDKGAVTRYRLAEKKESAMLTDLVKYANEFIMTPRPAKAKFSGNLVVLINGGTGSASEIFTAAMRDLYGKKTVNADGDVIPDTAPKSFAVVGSKSAGAVLFSTYVDTAHGFMLQMPVADYLTPSQARLEGNPIVPDVEAADPKFLIPGTMDKPIDSALALFERFKLRDSRAGGTQS